MTAEQARAARNVVASLAPLLRQLAETMTRGEFDLPGITIAWSAEPLPVASKLSLRVTIHERNRIEPQDEPDALVVENFKVTGVSP